VEQEPAVRGEVGMARPLTGVKASMWELARETGALRELLERSGKPDEVELERMRDHLDSILRALATLDKPDGSSVHPLLAGRLPAFREDVARARADLDKTPPALEGASEVVQTCTRCHVVAAAETSSRVRLARRHLAEQSQ